MQKSNECASLTKPAGESDPLAPALDTRAESVIVSFHQDDEGHWVASLSCGHTQHLRHQPPWQNRAWVVDAALRQAQLGKAMRCGWCANGSERL